jgi:hypothetical protein
MYQHLRDNRNKPSCIKVNRLVVMTSTYHPLLTSTARNLPYLYFHICLILFLWKSYASGSYLAKLTMRQRFQGILLLYAIPNLVCAYPNWMRCDVELESSEIIMGSLLIDFEFSDYKLFIEVKDMNNPHALWGRTFEYDDSTAILARLHIPEFFRDSSFMFVMDATGGATLDPPTCNGKRSVGREWNTEVIVNINGTYNYIDLISGWARAYEPVRLTQRIRLWKKGSDPIDDNNKNNKEDEEL